MGGRASDEPRALAAVASAGRVRRGADANLLLHLLPAGWAAGGRGLRAGLRPSAKLVGVGGGGASVLGGRCGGVRAES